MTEPCPDCAASASSAWHGFHTDCPGCKARAASRSTEFRNAQIVRVQSAPYRRLLEQMDVTHQQVLEAHSSDALNKEPT